MHGQAGSSRESVKDPFYSRSPLWLVEVKQGISPVDSEFYSRVFKHEPDNNFKGMFMFFHHKNPLVESVAEIQGETLGFLVWI